MAVHSMRDSRTMETPTSTADCRHGVISAATVLFPRTTTTKKLEAELEFVLPCGERRFESTSQVTVARTPSTLIPRDMGPRSWPRWRYQVHMDQFCQNRRCHLPYSAGAGSHIGVITVTVPEIYVKTGKGAGPQTTASLWLCGV